MKRQYYAACPLGVEEALAHEIQMIGGENVKPGRGAVEFGGDLRVGYAANLWCRSAIRIQEVLAWREVESEGDLYDFVMAGYWEDYMHVDQTLVVDSSVRDSFLTHSQYASQLVKDAICDQFRDRTGRRPSVDKKNADLPLKLFLNRNVATLYRDFSGMSLHKRGYRPVQVKSPLNEALAAGLILLAGWDSNRCLVDPMCGSGTIGIEAAMIASNRAPGLDRSFPFERWPDFDAGIWDKLYSYAREQAERGFDSIPDIRLYDRHEGAIGIAKMSIRNLGLENKIQVEQKEVAELAPLEPLDQVFTNPPYGERIGEGEDLERTWRSLGDWLKVSPGVTAFVLSGEPGLTKHLGLKTSRKWPFRNGPIDCRLLKYRIHMEQ